MKIRNERGQLTDGKQIETLSIYETLIHHLRGSVGGQCTHSLKRATSELSSQHHHINCLPLSQHLASPTPPLLLVYFLRLALPVPLCHGRQLLRRLAI